MREVVNDLNEGKDHEGDQLHGNEQGKGVAILADAEPLSAFLLVITHGVAIKLQFRGH